MRGLWKAGQGAGLCAFAACCFLSLGSTDAGDWTPSGSCPCGQSSSGFVAQAYAGPSPSVGIRGVYVAPLPPLLPPPGTLGFTYARQSWLIPADRHPRIAMLDVRAPAGTTNVRVLTTYEYREEDEITGFQDPANPCVWHFESKPLVPGIPQVYRVVADTPMGADARMVRLIRGRRVTLEY
ncbi:MAG: hypothetical protein JNG89_15710 [Planctomycetaceae bacterium]|nr:hypothetical protein [Planctomycetaceae bacterium]